MSLLYSIDPGLRACGLALFDGKELIDCKGVFANVEKGNGYRQLRAMADELTGCLAPDAALAIERMEPRKSKSSAWSSLIDLTLISGMVAGVHQGDVQFVRPSKWTGGYDKETNHPIIRKRLSKDEEKLLDSVLKNTPENNHKEVLDAVGVGLYVLRRLR